ncbi:hypothetical protein FF1_002853 [Malus domestica]|uniref:uncharacterized protein LOC126586220 n=1 Tax=Malus sylvestris TaxID=3752 RepID=UPI0021AC5840|nr:uncharacterized protein LOC126586220 [Malus sylvestris]
MENYSYGSYPESGNSSPRSRDIDFENTPPWEVDPANPQTQNYKAKFMCSYGGKILPRPHDNQLCYVGGETKIFAVDRNIKFAAIISKLSSLSEYDVSFKYQLPGEDLDALISVTNDDDLEHMMHEYDRLYRASGRPARMRLFLFNASPNGGFGSDDGRSDKDRFVEALNSGPTQAPDQNSKPPVENNVDFLFGMEKGGVPAVVSLPPPPAPTIPGQVAPPPEFVRSGHVDRVIGSDPVVTSVEFQRQLQRLQIGEQDQQAMYRRKNDDNLVGGYTGAGDYYVQKMPEKAPPVTAAPPAGYWPEKQVTSGGFPGTGAPEQPMYMFTSAPGGGAVYHAQPPMVRPVTGPPGQGYYQVQQRMGSEIYREQPQMYNVVPQPQQQQQQPTTLPPQPPKYVATYADTTPYTQVAYDSTTGRQVYYTAPGGVVQQQQQAYQAVGPAGVGGEMRAAGGLGQEGKVVGSKLPQASV